MRRRLAAAAAVALLVVPTTAWGEDAENLTRTPPWDAVVKTDGSVRALASLEVTTTDSPLELMIKGRITSDIQKLSASVGGPWSPAPGRDVLRTAIAAIANDKEGLEKAGGLASAVVRAALTYAFEEALPATQGCTREQRLNAVYEGFAMSAAFASFPFPERTGSAPSSCAALARTTQRLVDAAVIRQSLPTDARDGLGRVSDALDASWRACAGHTVPEGLSDDAKKALQATVEPNRAQTAEALVAARPHVKRALEEIHDGGLRFSAACSTALSAEALGMDPLAKLTDLGLGSVDTKALSTALRDDVLACGSPAACANRDLVVETIQHLRAGIRKDDLVRAVRFVAGHVGITPKKGSFENDLFGALEASVVADGDRVTLDQAEAVKYLSARYGIDDKGPPRVSTLIGLPTSVVLDVNAGIPAFSDTVRIVGDATVGYRSTHFGIVSTMGVNYFDLQSTNLVTDNLHAWGGIDSFYLTGKPDSKIRIQSHLSAALDYYDTTTIEAATTRGATFRFGDYDSLLLRALLEVGVVWRATEHVRLDARVGGGGQHETYDTTSLDATGVKFSSPETLSGRGTTSLTATWRFWPRHLAARVRASGSLFKLTRETVSFSASSTGRTQEGLTSSSETEMDLQGRGYVDLEYLKLFGIVPAAWFGSDYVSTPAAATIVPVAGIAFFRAD